LRFSSKLSIIPTSKGGATVQALSNAFSRIAVFAVLAKALLASAAPVVLGLSALLSTLVMILVLLVLIVVGPEAKRHA
jgi:hypothetical protein